MLWIDENSLRVGKKRLKPLSKRFKASHIPPFKFWVRLDRKVRLWISRLLWDV
jgi:hypothetical protein